MSVTEPETNPFRRFIEDHAALLQRGAALRLGGLTPPDRPHPDADAPIALIFSPHPDDECIVGGLPLRLLRELRMRAINVAVTLGRHPERQQARWRELEAACAYIGFGLVRTASDGLPDIDLATREQRPEAWSAAVDVIAAILEAEAPKIIFIPHDGDWHPAHIGTHHLVLDALEKLPSGFVCDVVETEFWAAMEAPNLMIGSSAADIADLVAALAQHVGEVARNPYHLRLPAWMIDNVRRGSELVQGKGEAAADITFATLYRLRRWADGRLLDQLPAGRVMTAADDLRPLFA